jgi:5-methyltetrahydrofolate--homocysteine methyltransferase
MSVARPAPAARAPGGQAALLPGDFVAPKDRGVPDWVGAFAVTAGLGIEAKLAEFEAAHDDYHAIMLKAWPTASPRPAPSGCTQRVRRECWGYAADETLDNAALIARSTAASARRRATRPARTTPSRARCSSCLESRARAHRHGAHRELRDDQPAAAVSGFYFAHPDSHYFAVSEDRPRPARGLGARTGMEVDEAARWLAPLL